MVRMLQGEPGRGIPRGRGRADRGRAAHCPFFFSADLSLLISSVMLVWMLFWRDGL